MDEKFYDAGEDQRNYLRGSEVAACEFDPVIGIHDGTIKSAAVAMGEEEWYKLGV